MQRYFYEKSRNDPSLARFYNSVMLDSNSLATLSCYLESVSQWMNNVLSSDENSLQTMHQFTERLKRLRSGVCVAERNGLCNSTTSSDIIEAIDELALHFDGSAFSPDKCAMMDEAIATLECRFQQACTVG